MQEIIEIVIDCVCESCANTSKNTTDKYLVGVVARRVVRANSRLVNGLLCPLPTEVLHGMQSC